jgi:hypothetical protein
LREKSRGFRVEVLWQRLRALSGRGVQSFSDSRRLAAIRTSVLAVVITMKAKS